MVFPTLQQKFLKTAPVRDANAVLGGAVKQSVRIHAVDDAFGLEGAEEEYAREHDRRREFNVPLRRVTENRQELRCEDRRETARTDDLTPWAKLFARSRSEDDHGNDREYKPGHGPYHVPIQCLLQNDGHFNPSFFVGCPRCDGKDDRKTYPKKVFLSRALSIIDPRNFH